MLDLSLPDNDEEGMPSPAANHQKTALEAEESEGLPIVNTEESEGQPVALVNGKLVKVRVSVNKLVGSGIELAPMDNLVRKVNDNLRICTLCDESRLELEMDRRVGFAVNWKLSCKSCAAGDVSDRNNLNHLKRQLVKCVDYTETRKVKKKIRRKKLYTKQRKDEKKYRYITAPLVNGISNEGRQRKVADYSVNIRAILSSFYVGTGGLDIGLINSCQGIGGSENWERTYSRHAKPVCKTIIEVIDEITKESLNEEIALTIKEKLSGKYTVSQIDELITKKLAGITTGIDEVDNVRISISFDMGWQKKGTGHTYDSNSGHAYYIGVRTGKVVAMVVYSKKCTTCDIAIAMGEEPMDHDDCVRNYKTGSSKAMEASAALELIVILHAQGISVEFIVSDNNSTMRAHLRHIGNDKGKLPIHVPEPTFLCDPSHRVKVMVKDIFGLALSSKTKSECEKIDALRLKKYYGCMIGKSKLLPHEKFQEAANAPVEHLFGCHEWCDPSWCYSAELHQARGKFDTAVATEAPTTTATAGEEVSILSPDEVITPTECRGVEVQIPSPTFIDPSTREFNTAVATEAPTTTATAGEEVSIPSPDEVITPTECRGVEVQIPSPTSVDSSTTPINILSDDSSKFSSCSEASDSEEDIDTYKGMYVEEDDDINFFRDLVPESLDGLETMVFSTTDLEALKDKERTLRAREEGKYFRSKVDHPILYGQITAAVAPYLAPDKLKMLQHSWSTQKNEAMNNSVAAYAPKVKNFSGTLSLKTRVGIAAGVLALGYFRFWNRVFDALHLDMDSVFATALKARDKKKTQKRVRQKSPTGKLKRRKTELATIGKSHKEQMEDARTGKTYGAGVALAQATKTAKAKHTAATRNPKGTAPEYLRCPYHHPRFRTVLGHTAASSKHCFAKTKTKEERKEILDTIKKWRIEEELALQANGTSNICRIFCTILKFY